jgi:hypothetical protein
LTFLGQFSTMIKTLNPTVPSYTGSNSKEIFHDMSI